MAQLLDNQSSGWPNRRAEVEPYSGKLGIEAVVQPAVGVGVSRFGTSFGGGVALAFTDTLRDH